MLSRQQTAVIAAAREWRAAEDRWTSASSWAYNDGAELGRAEVRLIRAVDALTQATAVEPAEIVGVAV